MVYCDKVDFLDGGEKKHANRPFLPLGTFAVRSFNEKDAKDIDWLRKQGAQQPADALVVLTHRPEDLSKEEWLINASIRLDHDCIAS